MDTTEPAAVAPRDVKLTLLGVLLALFLGALDQTIVSTALPKIVEDLHGLDRYAWVATSYLLASTALVPLYGRLADLLSRRALEIFAVSVFLTGSALCGLAGELGELPLLGDGMTQLIVFRAVQGLGGAGLFSLAFIVIADLFPPRERARYQGLVGATFGIASVVGPWLGGLLTDHVGWRWVFYVNLPVGAVALWVLVMRMPRLPPREEGARFDVLGAMLLLLGLVPLTLALQLDRQLYPWGSSVTLGLLGVALVALVAFVVRALRFSHPILDLSLFKGRLFTTANVALFFLGGAFLSILVFLPLFMVNVLGVSATEAGTSLIPLSAGLVFGAVGSGQLVARFGHYRRLMLAGLVVLLAGVAALSRVDVDVGYWEVTAYMVVCGIGLGPSFPLYTLAIQNAVPSARVGQATSASQFFRQMGGTVGVAIMGTVLASSLSASFATIAAQQPATMSEREGRFGGGIESTERDIRAGFAATSARVTRAVIDDDAAAREQLRADPYLPAEVKTLIERTATLPAPARALIAKSVNNQLGAREAEVVRDVIGTLKKGFADAITRIFLYSLVLVVLSLLVTLGIPELPLRSTQEPSPDVG